MLDVLRRIHERPDISWPALSAERSLWLWGEGFDLLAIAGGASILFTAAAILLAPFWPGLGEAAGGALFYLTFVCNGPHYAATYELIRRERGERPSQWAGLAASAPAAAVAIGAVLLWPGAALAPLRRLYVTLSPHHYASQHFGVAALYEARAGRPLDDGEKRLLRLAFLLVGAFVMILANTEGGVGPAPARAGAGYWAAAASLALPRSAYWAAVALAAAGAALYGAVELRARRRAGRGLGLPARLLFAANAVWFVLPNLRLPGADKPWPSQDLWMTLFIAYPFFHCLQYLGVASHRARRSGTVRPVYAFAGLVLGGGLLFQLPSLGLAKLRLVDLFTASAVFEVVFNLHHYWLDRLIWRRREPRPSTGGAPAAA